MKKYTDPKYAHDFFYYKHKRNMSEEDIIKEFPAMFTEEYRRNFFLKKELKEQLKEES